MGVGFSLMAMIILILIPVLGVYAGGEYMLGVVLPYGAFALFVLGVIYRIGVWARSPVPFRIPTTCGQQKTLSWIRPNGIENPTSALGVWLRMAGEIFLFRSLFRNTKLKLTEKRAMVTIWEKWLWLAAIIFHWSFLIIILRHLRFVTGEVPVLVRLLDGLDGFFSFGMFSFYLTDLLIVGALGFLLIRRLVIPMVRYVSFAADYFPLFLILGIGLSGILMKYFLRADVTAVKELALGLVTFHPAIPGEVGLIFYVHLFLVCVLLAYFPFSKLMHGPGLLLTPTRNMANNNRMARHVNPWNYPVHVHTYEEYEDEFRKIMQGAGLPLEKEG
ncbi:menaquinol oxidoreductase [Candidatus Formimonas warabiya]|uniref:Menaquinol oxidoreductase n=2 Tax=Formimonas warabiya TaxID=1761012 RepID=A0A3G1KY33_FORW1|nr:sulfate reduction electron transfer complex DsrMKJOP subunit DsrM [Candidatus Formimonas warabiya]ATW27376.1 menaquinol oxidoreductase [Candidatus Formimonas warabiya]